MTFKRIQAEIVHGMCPTCTEITMLVGLTNDNYRCMTCGTDLIQHVNGQITYLPIVSSNEKTKEYIKSFTDDGEKEL